MSIDIRTTNNTTSVRVITNKQPTKTIVASGIIMPRILNELLDVDTTESKDKYLIMYDSTINKYVAVNPDEVLSAATQEPTSPGLPSAFKDQLGTDLDNSIDLDAGTF